MDKNIEITKKLYLKVYSTQEKDDKKKSVQRFKCFKYANRFTAITEFKEIPKNCRHHCFRIYRQNPIIF